MKYIQIYLKSKFDLNINVFIIHLIAGLILKRLKKIVCIYAQTKQK